MEQLEKITTKASVLFSRMLMQSFGIYKSKINFLKSYRDAEKAAGNSRIKNIMIAVSAAVIIACTAAYIAVFLQLQDIKSETALIEPNINKEEEARLTAELASVREGIERYAELERTYEGYETAYAEAHFLTDGELESLYDAAKDTGVTIRGITYTQNANTAEIECLAVQPVPSDYIDSIKELIPGINATSTGYTSDRGNYRFTILCRFNPNIQDINDIQEKGEE